MQKDRKKFKKRFKFYQSKFSQIDQIVNHKVDTIVFDLGISSIQLNNLNRGFSFKSNKKLDMTMGLSDLSAERVVNNLNENELKLIIKIFGKKKMPQELQEILLKQD